MGSSRSNEHLLMMYVAFRTDRAGWSVRSWLFTGLRGRIDAHSGTVYSKGSGKRIEFLGHFCCTIIWPVCFIKTKIVIQSNSSGLTSIAQNRIVTSWQSSLRRGAPEATLPFFFEDLIQSLTHGRKHSTVDLFWASRKDYLWRRVKRAIGQLEKPNSLPEIFASSEKEQLEDTGYWVGF